MASVVIRSPAIDAAFCNAARTTLVGSMIPLVTRLTYSPFWASKPYEVTGRGPDSGGSKPGASEGCAHMPEKSGIACCVNTGDENRATTALVAMINVRMMELP
jgi:hypothetical protein